MIRPLPWSSVANMTRIANPVEYFADIPTNFRDTADLPPPIRAHFAPLIDASAPTPDFTREPDWPMDREYYSLATFQRWLAGHQG